LIKKKERKECLQCRSEENDEEISVVTSIAFNIFMNTKASLRRGRRERVRRIGTDEGA
jgi:hypothetical protein